MRNPWRRRVWRGAGPGGQIVLLVICLIPGSAFAAGPLLEAHPGAPGFRLLPDSLETTPPPTWAGPCDEAVSGPHELGRSVAGIAGFALLPQGEFAGYVGTGFGAHLEGTRYLDASRRLGIRLDLGFATYGHQSSVMDLGLVEMDVSTDNDIFMLDVGPQFRLGHGGLQGYVRGIGGLSYFVTTSSVMDQGTSHFSKTHAADLIPSVGLGGGLLIRVRKGPRPLYLDLTLEVRRQGTTRYARKGDVVLRGGRAETTTVRSRTDMVLIGLGVVFDDQGRVSTARPPVDPAPASP